MILAGEIIGGFLIAATATTMPAAKHSTKHPAHACSIAIAEGRLNAPSKPAAPYPDAFEHSVDDPELLRGKKVLIVDNVRGSFEGTVVEVPLRHFEKRDNSFHLFGEFKIKLASGEVYPVNAANEFTLRVEPNVLYSASAPTKYRRWARFNYQTDDPAMLSGKTVAILTADGFFEGTLVTPPKSRSIPGGVSYSYTGNFLLSTPQGLFDISASSEPELRIATTPDPLVSNSAGATGPR